jgi:hypothetical protein
MNNQYFDSLMNALSNQRNAALNDVVTLTAQNAMLQTEIEVLKAELAELKKTQEPLKDEPAQMVNP